MNKSSRSAATEGTVWTNKDSMVLTTVYRGRARIGTVKMLHRGYEARFAGVSTIHSTKAAAIQDLATRR